MANDDMRVFDWDDEIQDDNQGSFVILPPGIYPFTVTELERGDHPGSAKLPPCPKATLTCEVDGGRLGTAQVRRALFLCAKMEGMLCAFFSTIGERKHGEKLRMNWKTVEGKSGWCRLGKRTFTGNDGMEHEANEIQGFVDAPQPAVAAKKSGWNF